MLNLREFLGLEYYTSELDKFLIEYHKKHPKLSASQLEEKEKYAKIYALRDFANKPTSNQSFWDKF